MIKVNNVAAKTAMALLLSAYTAPLLAANGTKAQQGAENMDAIGNALGSAIYTIIMAIGLLLIGWSLWTWWQHGQDNQGNANKGETGKMLKAAIAGCAMTFPSAWMLFFGEAVGVVEASQSAVDYRDLVSQAAQ